MDESSLEGQIEGLGLLRGLTRLRTAARVRPGWRSTIRRRRREAFRIAGGVRSASARALSIAMTCLVGTGLSLRSQ